MRRLFDPDSPIGRFFAQLADLAVMSILWTVCSIPVITMGAASAALCRCAMNMARDRGGWGGRAFFRYFRENFRSATRLWLVLLPAFLVLGADLLIAFNMENSPALWRIPAILGMVLWLLTALWAFPLTAQFENTLGRTLKNAFLLGISWLPRTLLMAGLWLLPAAALLLSPYVFYRTAILWPVLLWGVTAYLCARVLVRPFAPYLEEDTEESSE